jgi:hypothetical protein
MSGWILLGVIAFIVVILGSFMFPGIHTVVTTVDTSKGGYIQNAITTLTPYAFLLAIPLGIYALSKRGGGQL